MGTLSLQVRTIGFIEVIRFLLLLNRTKLGPWLKFPFLLRRVRHLLR